ncbi:MAG: trypsin-like peptidase domain-containing protein [Lachnospiraceae bacterium]|nr:trypsin-like peptidase domain-containing protein [Lachnospiraceae bacterium]
MDENRYTNDYYTNRNQMNQGQVNQNQNSSSGTQGTNYYQTSSTNFQQSQMNHQQTKPVKQKKQSGGLGKKVLAGLCCGLVFGVFAGIGFQAVDAAHDGFTRAKSAFSAIVGNSSQDSALAEASGSGDAAEDVLLPDSSSDAAEASSGSIKQTLDNLTPQTQTEAVVTDVTQVVKAVMPSVVSVSNTYVQRGTFFGQEYSSEAVSSGSGIIVGENDSELLIVTNYHVVESADTLSVQFVDEEQVQAQIKGTDADKDLAVLAVQLSDIKEDTLNQISIASLGSSDDLTVGEPVIAIGNALGYGQSVTTGVVSALNRPIAVTSQEGQTGDSQINTFIQTDAAINPGNSGGALLNTKGEVIGINSNKIGGSTVEGMGYAIPISDAKPIIEELMQKETRLKVDEANKGVLGITGVNVEAQYSEVYGIPMGVYVSSVTDNSGAAAAGLVRGDIITAINGETVETMEELKEEMNYYQAGDVVTLTIMQGSPTGYQSKDVQVTLGKQMNAQ